MKKIFWVVLFFSCLSTTTVFAQKENPMTKEKGQRTPQPVNTDNLKPLKIDGRKSPNNQPSSIKQELDIHQNMTNVTMEDLTLASQLTSMR